MLVGDLAKVKSSAGSTCSLGFAGGTYHSSRVFTEVTRIELSARTARFSRKYPLGKTAAVLNVAFFFFTSIGYSKSSTGVARALNGSDVYLRLVAAAALAAGEVGGSGAS